LSLSYIGSDHLSKITLTTTKNQQIAGNKDEKHSLIHLTTKSTKEKKTLIHTRITL